MSILDLLQQCTMTNCYLSFNKNSCNAFILGHSLCILAKYDGQFYLLVQFGGCEMGSMYVLSYQICWYVHITLWYVHEPWSAQGTCIEYNVPRTDQNRPKFIAIVVRAHTYICSEVGIAMNVECAWYAS